MSDLPKKVHVREVGPREGFQFEKAMIPTADKIAAAVRRVLRWKS